MKKPVKIGKEIVDLLLPRLKDEFNAYYFYRSASNWCKNVGYFKAAAFFAAESTDELTHAKKIEDYITDWNVLPILPTIQAPEITFGGLVDVLEKAYDLEYNLYEAYEETSVKVFKTQDMCTFDFLQPLRKIQTDSVAEYSDKLNVLDGVSPTDKFQLLMLEENLFE